MIWIFAVKKDGTYLVKKDLTLSSPERDELIWYWVDFDAPTEEETRLLRDFFHFHPLAIEDCINRLQRPKLDHYGETHFFVLHALQEKNLIPEELNLFLGTDYLVTYHHHPLPPIGETRGKLKEREDLKEKSPLFVAYLLIDKLVDHYFPVLEEVERRLDNVDDSPRDSRSIQNTLDYIYSLRADLLQIRRTIVPMRDLLYRIVNSSRLTQEYHPYFLDIYDHLTKLSDMVEEYREMTADLRDSTLSLYSFRMNTIMKTLTVITTIFMPLTFIAGIYGMNFHYMPELSWRYGYFVVLGAMSLITFGMLFLFYKKGWFR
ncbi:magnesium/cobalt transporter CorA [Thermicanus aegyptius]|uniref:magnesium/cobalt transporter CorA n=1 Tax=Thermicanus aegyptius TaxID=94009 RepID=UPI000414C209|nr:magnesium/cobalt transporter CorA [Thermicanus aegyptius]